MAIIASLHSAMIDNVSELIADYERGYDAMIDEIWTGVTAEEQTNEVWNSPFMRAGRTSARESVKPVELPGEHVIEELPSRE